MAEIYIADRKIGEGAPCFVIAEVAQAHDGSLGMAHAFIDAAADSKADAVKFQTHIAEAESTRDEPFRIAFSRQDVSRYDYWKRMEFTAEQWRGLKDHAAERGIAFLSSAFSFAAIDLLERIGMPAWKIGSGEFRSKDLLERIMAVKQPVLFSTGMANWREIDDAVSLFEKWELPFALLQCTSRYPAPLDLVGLNVIDEMKNKFSCPAGLSDHSASPYPAYAAIAKGADVLEVHVTFDRKMFGPDASSSLTFAELAMVAGMRDACNVMFSHPVDKNAVAEQLGDVRKTFSKSLALARPLSAGTILEADMLISKKPGSGIPPSDLPKVIGRKLNCDVSSERLLRWSDISGEPDA